MSYSIIFLEEVVISLLTVAVLVGIFSRRLRMPYTLGLVLIGLALAIFAEVEVHITSELILGVLVPPLIFEAAFHIRWEDLRRDLGLILALAVAGVVLATGVVGGIVHYGLGMPLAAALVFGALVAATDPVAVVALFRSLGAPKRLQVLLEGESLFNDGTAIVVFNLLLGVLVTGTYSIAGGLIDFVRVAGGGFLVGGLLGALVSAIIARVDDYLLETALTAVLAYGAFLVAEQAHVSGVLAVVAAGLINGNIGPRGMSATTRIVVVNFWEFTAFLANSFIFLLIGLQIRPEVLLSNWYAVLWAVLAIIVARALSVYGLSWIGRDLPSKWRHVLYWGGLRGAVSLALALGIPESVGPLRDQISVMAFGVVLFTLLVQGGSMPWVLKWLGIGSNDEERLEFERRHARAVAARAGHEYLTRAYRQGVISAHTWEVLRPLLEQRNQRLQRAVEQILRQHPALQMEELHKARLEILRAQRIALQELFHAGVIGEETFATLAAEVDSALSDTLPAWPGMLLRRSPDAPPIRHLLMAIVQERTPHAVAEALGKLGIPVVPVESSGGFLKRPNITMLIGVPEGQIETVVEILKTTSRRRVEFVADKIGGVLPLPRPKPVHVGGATVFLFDVDEYIEL